MSVDEGSNICFRANELAISFNGGKDSVVLLHLIKMAIEQRNNTNPTQASDLGQMITIYFQMADSFREVDEFMKNLAEEYQLRVVYLGCFKTGLENLKSTHGDVKGIFMGTRRVDPDGGIFLLHPNFSS